MASLFLADPVLLKQEGDKLITQAFEFNSNVEKVYETIHQLTSSSYVSDASRAIASEIEKFRDDLDSMTKAIRAYGKYLLHASNSVNANENRIIDNIEV